MQRGFADGAGGGVALPDLVGVAFRLATRCEFQGFLAASNGKKYAIESKTKKAPKTRNITVMILVFRARHSGVGGGLILGWRVRRAVVHAL
jgi:hypothetical protein